MKFLRNAWYCAAWDHEVTRTPLARTLLGRKVVLYRKEDGGVVALDNICPHRFAPLHSGKLHGDDLACPYHGLRFGEGGKCTLNPHGDLIPPTLRVRGYPIVERDAIIWIWMGDPDRADPDDIRAFPAHVDPDFVTVSGLISVKGSYQLVADNLLDLSHTQYLHPVLITDRDPDSEIKQEFVYGEDSVTTFFRRINVQPFGFVNFVWPDAPRRINSTTELRWTAPANMALNIYFDSLDPDDPKQLRMLGAELITPETETSCHYFFSSARDFRQDDTAFSETLRETLRSVFTNEDGAMIGEVQENMEEETDLIAMRPVILPTDTAAVQARRMLRQLIKRENAAESLEEA